MGGVRFAQVLAYLEERGFKLQRRRKYPVRDDAYFVLFTQEDLPEIGFPVVAKQVAAAHFDRIRQLLESDTDAEDQEDA